MRRNNRTNRTIMWAVIVGDFVLLNAVLLGYDWLHHNVEVWQSMRQFFTISNVALLISEWKFHSTIHERVVSAGDILKRIVQLTTTQALIAYVLMRHVMYWMGAGWMVLEIGTIFSLLMIILRLMERNAIKRQRRLGRNTRTITLVGNDAELQSVYKQIIDDPTTGYRIAGRWAADELVEAIEKGDAPTLGDELYVCVSRKEREKIRLLARECDKQVTKFFYVPISVESIGLKLKRDYINDIEVFVTHESPLENPANRLLKRGVDVVLSIVALLITAVIYPIVWIVIKTQSPGPIFFRQERTGLDGKNYMMLKFRSMHVNKDADKLQATKDDPRKFPFGNFMRKSNIDELPQFWNVLRGDMSFVGPRPHMLAHTEMYSKLIDQYMVRHFVKPGITGWAQVTGYRGETKELWQMEGRVKRDIWYIENWSIWLDIRIIWLTIKTFVIHDKNAY